MRAVTVEVWARGARKPARKIVYIGRGIKPAVDDPRTYLRGETIDPTQYPAWLVGQCQGSYQRHGRRPGYR